MMVLALLLSIFAFCEGYHVIGWLAAAIALLQLLSVAYDFGKDGR